VLGVRGRDRRLVIAGGCLANRVATVQALAHAEAMATGICPEIVRRSAHNQLKFSATRG